MALEVNFSFLPFWNVCRNKMKLSNCAIWATRYLAHSAKAMCSCRFLREWKRENSLICMKALKVIVDHMWLYVVLFINSWWFYASLLIQSVSGLKHIFIISEVHNTPTGLPPAPHFCMITRIRITPTDLIIARSRDHPCYKIRLFLWQFSGVGAHSWIFHHWPES